MRRLDEAARCQRRGFLIVKIAFPSSRLFTNAHVRRSDPTALPSRISALSAARASF